MSEKEILELIEETTEVRKNAYAKYSDFNVGAIVIDENGKHFKGVNVENASYGLSICAERNAIFSAVTNGMKNIKIICVVGKTLRPISPCGACRQVMKEFSSDETIIVLANLDKKYKIFTMEELLPYGFSL